MADSTQTVHIVKDGRSGAVQYPSDWSNAQIDAHLAENGARRFTPRPTAQTPEEVMRIGPVQVDVGASPLYRYVKNMSTTEKAILIGTLPLGGPEIGAGIKLLGGTITGAGKLARLGSAGIQMLKGAVAGGTGAALEQQIGEEGQAPSVKQGAFRGFLTALSGEVTQPILNSMSKMFMGHITQSFVDSQSLKGFLTKLAPDLAASGDNPAQVFNAVMRGKLAVTAQQQIQQAVETAAQTATQKFVNVPELVKVLKDTGLSLRIPIQQFDEKAGIGLLSIKDAMDAHAALAQFSTRGGEQLSGKAPALIQNIRDHAEEQINAALGDKAAGLWTAGKVRYGALMRVNDFLTDQAADTFKTSGVPNFEALQRKFLTDFGGDAKVQRLMGQTYEDLMQTVFRQGSVLVKDVPGYMPRVREAFGAHAPRAYLGMPVPATLAGNPGEIPAGFIDPLAALAAPSLGNIPTGIGP